MPLPLHLRQPRRLHLRKLHLRPPRRRGAIRSRHLLHPRWCVHRRSPARALMVRSPRSVHRRERHDAVWRLQKPLRRKRNLKLRRRRLQLLPKKRRSQQRQWTWTSDRQVFVFPAAISRVRSVEPSVRVCTCTAKTTTTLLRVAADKSWSVLLMWRGSDRSGRRFRTSPANEAELETIHLAQPQSATNYPIICLCIAHHLSSHLDTDRRRDSVTPSSAYHPHSMPLRVKSAEPLPPFTFSPGPPSPRPLDNDPPPPRPPADFIPERDMNMFGAMPLAGQSELGRGLVKCGRCGKPSMEWAAAEHKRQSTVRILSDGLRGAMQSQGRMAGFRALTELS